MTDAPRTTGTDTAQPLPIGTIDLAIGGMTCASCVARVEKKLNKVPGAEALVNLATETARVTLTDDVDVATPVAAVESAGYTARVTRRAMPHAAHAGAGSAGAKTVVGLASGPAGDAGRSSTADPASEDTSAPEPDRGEDLKRRLRLAVVLAVPVVLVSMIPALQFRGWQWVVAALALPVVTWCALPFHRAAWRAAKHGASTMDTLVSLGIIAATTWSLWALLFGGAGELGMEMHPTLFPWLSSAGAGSDVPELYFEVAAVVTAFLLAGRYAEYRSRRRAGDALRALLTLGAKDVALLTTGPDGRQVESRVPIDRLAVGDEFAVRPGEKVATDGVVVRGASALDTSLLTGEPVPVDVRPGSEVTGATLNTSGHLVVRATRVGEQTMLAQIGRLVTTAQTGKAPVQRLADRISAVFVPIVLGLSVSTLVAWLALGHGAQSAFTAAVAVLIIACPCALGLATPTALLVGSGRGAQLGILIKGPQILESTRRVDTVVLDKTGTVTEGRMELVDVVAAGAADAAPGTAPAPATDAAPGTATAPADDAARTEVLRLAGAVEALSEHPIAQAIVAVARATVDELPEVHEFVNDAGRGVSGVVRPGHSGVLLAQRVLVGRPSWLVGQGITLPDPDESGSPAAQLAAAFRAAETSGATAVMVAWSGAARGLLVLRDPAKPTSAEAVRELRALGLRPVLLTGDNRGAAVVAASAVGIEPGDVIAEVLPAEKVDAVAALQRTGAIVAMVGDGVNDAAALAQANLGLAMGTGTDVAIEAADITLVRGDLRSAAQAIRLSRRTLRIIKQNLFWAFAYNVAAIPLAALGLLNPMIAGAAMAFSSVLVVSNSLRLRRFS